MTNPGFGGRADDERFAAAGAESGDEPEVETVVIDIEQTREEMTETVEAIGDKLDPAHIVQNAGQTVRDATVGKVERMADQAGTMFDEAGRTAQQAGGGIVETLRQNPIPAAMVGLGLTWLLMNRSTGDGGGMRGQAYGSYRADYGGGSSGIRERAGAATGEIGRTAGDAMERARHMTDDVSRQAGQGLDEAMGQTRQVARQAQGTVERMLEENALVAGAVAVAVGAAIGAALPATRVEQQWMGEAGRDLGEAGRDLARQAETKAEQTMQQMEDEARREG